MSHQVNIFILLFGALQGILLSVWMLRYEKKKISNRYLSAFLIVVGLQLTFKVISKTWVMDYALIPYVISYKLPYLIGPLLYLFVRSRQEETWKPLDLLHFIPFVFFTAIEFLWSGPSFHPYAQAAFQAISLGIYTFLSLAAQQQVGETVRSICRLCGIYHHRDTGSNVCVLWQVSRRPLFVYGSHDPYLLDQLQSSFEVQPLFSDQPRSHGVAFKRNVKYSHSSLKPEEANRIMNNLTAVMQDGKAFCGSFPYDRYVSRSPAYFPTSFVAGHQRKTPQNLR